jgi:hypothetical protein
MKKAVMTILAILTLVAIPAASVSAKAPASPDFTVVYGYITNKGKDIKGAKVSVICNGHALKTTSDASGYYSVSFMAGKCAPGSTVSVTATKGQKGGERNGAVSWNSADLNVALINVSLPELSFVTGTAAVIVAGGAFFLIRRRDFSAKQQ